MDLKFANNHKAILDQTKHKFAGKGFEIIDDDGTFYLHIQTPYFRILFQDLNSYKKRDTEICKWRFEHKY